MINVLTTAQINGTLEKKLREYTRPQLLLLDELGYLPIDKRGADLMFQVVAARYECGSIVITTNRIFREWGKIFDVAGTHRRWVGAGHSHHRPLDASRRSDGD
jgi:DNA replication protein DnaC